MPIDYYTSLHPRTAVIADFLCMRTKRSDFSAGFETNERKVLKIAQIWREQKKQLQFDEALNAEFYRFFFLVQGFLEAYPPCEKKR